MYSGWRQKQIAVPTDSKRPERKNNRIEPKWTEPSRIARSITKESRAECIALAYRTITMSYHILQRYWVKGHTNSQSEKICLRRQQKKCYLPLSQHASILTDPALRTRKKNGLQPPSLILAPNQNHRYLTNETSVRTWVVAEYVGIYVSHCAPGTLSPFDFDIRLQTRIIVLSTFDFQVPESKFGIVRCISYPRLIFVS